jgi:hypothetical protein
MFSISKLIIIIKCIIASLFLQYFYNSNILAISNSSINISRSVSAHNSLCFLSIKINNFGKVKQNNLSSEVIIYGLNNYLLKNKMKFFFATMLNTKNYVDKCQIQSWINVIKLSGFFQYVSYNLYYYDNFQIVVIDVVPNSIFTKVYVINYQDKLIPSSYILFLFRLQLGYPKSFAKINNTIKQMIKWYHLRGYQWAQIQLQHLNCQNHSITINIYEGKIKTIKIVSSLANKKQLINHGTFIINSIVDTLKLKPNHILNIKSLETGIINLKLQRIILRCNYEIIINYLESESLNIKLLVEILDHTQVFFFIKNILVPFNLFESLESLVESSIDYFMFNNLKAQILFINKINFFTNRKHLIDIYNQKKLLYIDISYYDSLVFKLLNLLKIRDLKKIDELYITPLILIMSDNLGLRYYIYNINSSSKNFIFDIHSIQKYLQFNCKYEDSWFYFHKGHKISMYFWIFQNIYMYDFKNSTIILDQFTNQCFSSPNTFLYQKGLQGELKHCMNTFFYFTEKINLKRIAKQYIILYNHTSWSNLVSLINSYNPNILSQYKQIIFNNTQQFLSFLFNFTYKNIQNISNFRSENKFIMESIYFVPETLIIPQQFLNLFANYNYNLRFTLLQSYPFQFLPFSLQNEFLRFTIEFLTSFSCDYYFPFGEFFCLLSTGKMLEHKESILFFPNLKFTNINIEYHFILRDQYSLYTFIDYIDNIFLMKNNINIVGSYNSYILNKLSQHLVYGVGVEVQIPIRQRPSIKLEYSINIYSNKCFHLKINKYD